MGALVETTNKTHQAFNPENWKQIKSQSHVSPTYRSSSSRRMPPLQPLNPAFKYYNKPKRLQNQLTGQQVFQYQMLLTDQDQYNQAISDYRFREENKKYIVAPKYIYTHNRNEMCSTHYTIKLYMQYMPLKLEDISKISVEDFVYILESALEGFRLLYRRFGAFRVDSNLISINTEGIIKVWINPDYSKNWPTISTTSSRFEKKSVYGMIRKLIEIVQEQVDWTFSSTNSHNYQISSLSNNDRSIFFERNSSVSLIENSNIEKFSSFLQKSTMDMNSSFSFEQAQTILKAYVTEKNITVPKFLTSILKRIKAIKGIYDSQIMSSNNFDGRLLQFKESNVFPVKTEALGFYEGIRKESIFHSQSSKTFADRLINGAESKSGLTDRFSNKNKDASSLFESLLANTKSMASQENLGNKQPYSKNPKFQKEPRSKYPESLFLKNRTKIDEESEQSLLHSKVSRQRSFQEINYFQSPKFATNASCSVVSQAKNTQKERRNSLMSENQDGMISGQFKRKSIRITFSYNSPTENVQSFCLEKVNDFEESENEISSQSREIREIEDIQQFQQCRSPNAQTYTSQKQLDLDPQILADLHKYSQHL